MLRKTAKISSFYFRLFVVRGSPEDVFPKLFTEWNVQKLTWEVDTEPYAQVRDGRIKKLAKDSGVKVEDHVGHTLYNTER